MVWERGRRHQGRKRRRKRGGGGRGAGALGSPAPGWLVLGLCSGDPAAAGLGALLAQLHAGRASSCSAEERGWPCRGAEPTPGTASPQGPPAPGLLLGGNGSAARELGRWGPPPRREAWGAGGVPAGPNGPCPSRHRPGPAGRCGAGGNHGITECFGLGGAIRGHLARCPEKLWLPPPWQCPRPGWMELWAPWAGGRGPCSWQGGWNQMSFKVPPNPNHSMSLWSSAGSGCSEPRPAWSPAFPGMGHWPPSWAISSRVSPPSW